MPFSAGKFARTHHTYDVIIVCNELRGHCVCNNCDYINRQLIRILIHNYRIPAHNNLFLLGIHKCNMPRRDFYTTEKQCIGDYIFVLILNFLSSCSNVERSAYQ